MGTWGAGSFQNDWALDWLGGLRESVDASHVRAALSSVVEHGGTKHSRPSILERLRGRRRHSDWLTARVAAKALAAAEIVAAWRGHPAANLPDGTMVVVNNAQSAIGHQADVQVQSLLQTGAGVIVFAELKHGEVAELYRLIGRLKDSVQTASPNGTNAPGHSGEGD